MLPTKKTPPKSDLRDLSVLLYGPSKSGKSEMCSQADNALFLATEAGLNHLEVYQVSISTWDDLLGAAKEVAAGQHKFRTIIVDTVDNAYRMCADYVCAKFKVDHESDLEYGKGYSLVNAEFHRVLNKLALLPYGLWLVSHAQDKEIQTRTGKHTKTVPTLPDKARKLVLGMVDIILFGDVETLTGSDGKPAHRRVLRTKPSVGYEAGDRTKRLPETIDFSYAAFAAAFAQGTRPPATTTAPPANSAATSGAPPASSGSGPASPAPAVSSGAGPAPTTPAASSDAGLVPPASPASSGPSPGEPARTSTTPGAAEPRGLSKAPASTHRSAAPAGTRSSSSAALTSRPPPAGAAGRTTKGLRS